MLNIYVVGNVKVFFGVLTGLQMIFNPLNHTPWSGAVGGWGGSAVALALVASLIGLVVSSLINSRFLMHHVIIMAVAYGVLFGVTTSVNITNIYNGQSNIVRGIPIGVAVPASAISTAAWNIAETMGTALQQADNTDTYIFSTTTANEAYGFAGPLALMYDLRGMYSTFAMSDPALSKSITYYVDFCFTQDSTAISDMGQAKNLAATLFSSTLPNPNLTTTLFVNGGDNQVAPYKESCGDAEGILDTAWTNFENGSVPEGVESLGSILGKQTANSSMPESSASEANTLIGSVLNQSANGGFDFMNNMILNCEVQAGENAGYDVYGDQLQLSSYCETKATAFGRAVTLNATQASLFKMNMVPMMAILQFLFFAGAPIIALMMVLLGPAGLSKFGAYIVFGFSTMMWIPIAQIITVYNEYRMSNTSQQIMNNLHGEPLTAPANIPLLLQHAMLDLGAADKMLALTPVVTLALLGLGGAYALTRLGQDQTSDGASKEAIGETTPMPGTDTLQTGIAERQVASTGTASILGAGMAAGEITPALNNLRWDSSAGFSQQAQASQQSALEYTNQAMTSAAEAAGTTAQIMNSRSAQTSSYLKNSTTATHEWGQLQQEASQIGKATDMTSQQAMQFSAALKAELGGNLMAVGGAITADEVSKALSAAKLGGAFTTSQIGSITKAVNDKATRSAMNSVTSSQNAKLAEQVATGTDDTNTQNLGASLARSAARTRQNLASAAAARKQAQAYSQMASSNQQLGGGAAWTGDTMLSALSNYENTRGKTQADAQMLSMQTADMNDLGGIWEKELHKGEARVGPGNGAVAYANMATFLAGMMSSPQNAANFQSDMLRKLGGYVNPGAGVAGRVAAQQQRIATGTNFTGNRRAMGAAAALTGGVDAATNFGGGPGNVAATNAEFGAHQAGEQGRYGGINPEGMYSPGTPQADYRAWKAAASKLEGIKGWSSFRKAIKHASGSGLEADVSKFMADHPEAANIIQGALTGLGFAGGAAAAIGAGYMIKKGGGKILKGVKINKGASGGDDDAAESPVQSSSAPEAGSSAAGDAAGDAATSAADEVGSATLDFFEAGARVLGLPAVALQAMAYSGGMGRPSQEWEDKYGGADAVQQQSPAEPNRGNK